MIGSTILKCNACGGIICEVKHDKLFNYGVGSESYASAILKAAKISDHKCRHCGVEFGKKLLDCDVIPYVPKRGDKGC